MSVHDADWELVGGHPAPGDAAEVRVLSGRFDGVSQSAFDARLQLDAVIAATEGATLEGAAAKRFAAVFPALPPDLGAMATGYDRSARALEGYARELDAIQHAAAQALTRAQLAQRQRDAAGRALGEARARVGSMHRQLSVVSGDERIRTWELRTAIWSAPETVPALEQELAQVRARRFQVEVALGDAQAAERSAGAAATSADTDLRVARQQIDGHRADADRAAHAAAARIREALPPGLRNLSTAEKLIAATVDTLKTVAFSQFEILGSALRGDWDAVVYHLQEYLDALEVVALVVAVVAGAAVVIATGGTGAAAIPLIWGIYTTATTATALAGAALTAVQAGARLHDRDGERAARWGEAAWDAAFAGVAVASLGGKAAKAAGADRQAPKLVRSIATRIDLPPKPILVAIEVANDAITANEWRERALEARLVPEPARRAGGRAVEVARDALRHGGGTPVVTQCFVPQEVRL